ncbi:MAG: DUF4870 family protein [Alphaproteobacteria bacterium]
MRQKHKITNIDADETHTDIPKIIYLLHLGGLFVGITAFIGLGMVYFYRSKAPDWMRSHYTLLEQTFWKGLVMGIAGAILKPVLIGYLIWAFVIFWWLARCIRGIQALARREELERPFTWGWRV